MSSPEASARALLLDMQSKLAAGPHTALGLPTHATASDIRSAFLQLTKVFHPARFGRMTVEIQRLSNEVFLALRAAHDQIAKPQTKPSGRSASTTAIPVTKQPATTRPFGVPVTPTTNPGTRPPSTKPEPGTTPPHRSTQPMPTTVGKPPAAAGPAVRPTPMPPPSSGTRPPPQQPPSAGTKPPPQTPPPSAGTRPPPPQTPTRASQPGGTIRFPTLAKPASPTAPPAPTTARPAASSSTGATLDPELALILQLMGMGQWDAAQAAIDALVSKNPQNKRYAALACYSRGRRAQLEGNLRIAQIELNDALKLDPDLDVAKSAFAELYARRK